MEYLISICIPTYNRAEELKKTLGRIAELAKEAKCIDQIEVCISDNSSSDNTSIVAESFSRDFKAFRLIRHPKNIGFQANLHYVAKLATGNWILILGDDDSPAENFVKLLLLGCQKNSEVVVFNSDTGDNRQPILQTQNVNDCVLDLKTAFELLGSSHASYLGNVMYRRSALINVLEDAHQSSAYPHLIAFWKVLTTGGKAFVLDECLTIGNQHNRDWTVWQPIFTSIDMAKILNDGPLSLPMSTIKKFKHFLTNLKSLVRASYMVRIGALPNRLGNPYRELTLRNIQNVYSSSWLASLVGQLIFVACTITPLFMINLGMRWIGRPNQYGVRYANKTSIE